MKAKKMMERMSIATAVLAIFLYANHAEAATRNYQIDFGRSTSQTTTAGWNNIIDPRAGTSIPLIDSTGVTATSSLTLSNSFYYSSSPDFSTNINGTSASALYPATATGDSFFIGTLNDVTDNNAAFTVNGLDNTHTYDFRFYASRVANDGGNRTTQYTIGATTASLNATDNVNQYVDILGVSPTNGTVTIAVSKASGATYGYLGVLAITEHLSQENQTPPNNAPTANAGADQAITLPVSSVSLNGTGTDSDGTITSYAWSFVSGPTTPGITTPAAAATTITGLTVAGTYVFQLTVTDNQGETTPDTISVTVNQPTGSNTPYGGTPRAIPGTIQAEDFDLGGEGVAYHDNDAANAAGRYRPSDGVDIEVATGNGYDIGWTNAGEWMKYTVDVAASGSYTIGARVSAPSGSPSIRFEMDGTTLATLPIPITGGWQSWQTVPTGLVSLTQGQHVLRIYEVTNNFNIDSVTFTANGAPSNIAPTANAGADQTITLPTHVVTLNGSGTDTDGTIASYAWTEVSNGGATIVNPQAASTMVTDLGPGTYTFRLTDTDNLGATGTDTIIVTVNPEPVAACSAQKIVVLGSSTAAGYGLNPVSDSWVNRYATYLTGLNVGNNVSNLAVSGYSSYQLLPTGSSTQNRPAPDTAHNITAAIAQHPQGIIVNLPSNDTANGYTLAEQEANFQIIAAAAANAGIPIWFTTTQPRNLSAAQITEQEQMRDWISNTYGDHALDFWSVVANPDGTVNAIYGQGDGIHLNALGHQKLFNRTAGAGIMVSLCSIPVNTAPTANAGADQTIMLPTSSITFNGSGTDTDGTVNAYAWNFVSGPATPSITSPSNAITTVTGLTAAGTYTFRLTVTDNQEAVGTDDMLIIVQQAANNAPSANASLSMVTLSGSGVDTDGSIASYLWNKISGGIATITTPNAATTTVTNLSTGAYIFRLTVTDNLGSTGTKDMQFTIN